MSKIRIVILDKGFVSVGKFTQGKDFCKLENAATVRYWGTTRGLGEIAENGPTDSTKLDRTPTQHIPVHSIVNTIECVDAKWNSHLGVKAAKK